MRKFYSVSPSKANEIPYLLVWNSTTIVLIKNYLRSICIAFKGSTYFERMKMELLFKKKKVVTITGKIFQNRWLLPIYLKEFLYNSNVFRKKNKEINIHGWWWVYTILRIIKIKFKRKIRKKNYGKITEKNKVKIEENRRNNFESIIANIRWMNMHTF